MSEGKILVIDDEERVLTICHRLLTNEGYDVKMAKSGIDSLKILENEAFDLALIDIVMPDIDGIKVLRHIKGKWPDTEVVMITAYSTIATAISAIKLGAYDYIEKPFTPDRITQTIQEALDKKQKKEKQIKNESA